MNNIVLMKDYLLSFLPGIFNRETTHERTPIPVPHELPSILDRVETVAFKAFFWVVWSFAAVMAVATVIPAAVVLTKRIRSHRKMNQTIQAMAENRYMAVRSSIHRLCLFQLENATPGDLKFEHDQSFNDLICTKKNESLKEHYVIQVHRLIQMVQMKTPPKGDLHAHMQLFREKLDELLAHPIYQENKGKKDNFFVQVLQDAAHTLIANSSGMAEMQELGKDVAGKMIRDTFYPTFAKVLKGAVERHAEFRNDSKIQKIFWSFSHPQKALAASMDATGVSKPTAYNSYQHGNASIQVGEFKVGKVKFSLSQAPTFSCDRLTEAARDRGDKRIVQDIEEVNGPSGEKGRVEAKIEASNTSLSGKEGKILHVHTPVDIHGEMKAQNLLQLDPKLVKAVDDVLIGNEEAKAVAYAALKGLQTMMDQEKVVREGTVYFNQSCKQNIDRGVAVNVATILFADAISDKKVIDKERAHQLVGMVLTRPVMVDDRAILEKRLKPLLDLIEVMPRLFADVQSHFKSNPISFEASNPLSSLLSTEGEDVVDQDFL